MPEFNDIKTLDQEAIGIMLQANGGNVLRTAAQLNVSRAALRRWIERQGNEPAEETTPEVKDLRRLERTKVKQSEDLSLTKKKLKEAEKELAELTRLHQATTDAFRSHDSAKIQEWERKPSRGSATGIICCTDWHVEGKVDPALIDGVDNEFDLDIAAKRIERLWNKAVYMSEFTQNISNIKDHVLWLGGDLINGAIHEELEESNFLGPTDAVLFVQDQIAGGIDFLLKHLKGPLIVATNQGNHGRTTKKKRISTGYLHSWEYLAYCNLARIYRNSPRVSFKIAQGYHNYLDVQGHTVRFHHGDAIKSNGGVGGITIPARKKVAQWNKQRTAAFDVFGHFHQFINMWDMVPIGCLVGYNEYAMEIAADFQPPTQGFIVVDRSYGKVIADPIFVQKAA